VSDEWVFGVDASFDELTLEEAHRLKAAGVQVYAQCLWTGAEQPASRVISLRNAWLAGLTLVGYISVSSGRVGWAHVNAGRSGVPQDLWDALVKVPIDVELEGLSFDSDVVAALNAVAELGKPRDVYTSFNAWVNLLGNPTRPIGVGLWNAFWDGDPDVDFPRLPYGGWLNEEVWGEQWSGGTHVEGQFVDRNTFRAAAFGLVPPAPEPPPPEPEPAPEPPPPEPDPIEALRGEVGVLRARMERWADLFAELGGWRG
jgi:hypothetical protein